MKSALKKPIERIVRGLAFWIAYHQETCGVKFTEAEAVGEIIKILQSVMSYPAKVCREVQYKTLCPSIKYSQRADLGIFFDDKCQCLLEVKLSENTNGGFKKDIKKLAQVKRANTEIDCYVILLYRNSCNIDEPTSFVSPEGKALKKTKDVNGAKIRVRRVSNALCSPTAKKMKKVVCFEIL